jgi:hypothetical protein
LGNWKYLVRIVALSKPQALRYTESKNTRICRYPLADRRSAPLRIVPAAVPEQRDVRLRKEARVGELLVQRDRYF